MAKPKKMKNLLGTLKDKVSLLKATLLLTPKPTTFINVAVLRATTHDPSDPPPDHTLDDVLTLTHQHRPTASALVHALLHRVHHTSSAYVALKCLITLHHLISRGSPVLNDYITGPHLLNLSMFRDQSDADTWELSNWVRWYADVLDQKICLPAVKSLNMLVKMLEQICGAPETLHYQRMSLVYEVIKLVGEDYRIIMRQIYSKVFTLGENISDFHDDSLHKFLGDLRRIEGCKEKLFLMFLNKKKNDGVWELIEKVRSDAEVEKERRESLIMVNFEGGESTRASRVDESRSLVVVPTAAAPRVKRWLDVEWNTLVLSTA